MSVSFKAENYLAVICTCNKNKSTKWINPILARNQYSMRLNARLYSGDLGPSVFRFDEVGESFLWNMSVVIL
jgi:hypothetical protein